MSDNNTVLHKFVSAKSQSPDPTLVSKNEWNEEHNFDGGSTGLFLGWDAAQTDNVNWLPSGIPVTGLPSAGTAGKIFFDTTTQQLYMDNGTVIKPVSPFIDVANLATSGNGSEATPWLGWHTVIDWTLTRRSYYFRPGYYNFGTTITVTTDRVNILGSGKFCTQLQYTGSSGNGIVFDRGSSGVVGQNRIEDLTLIATNATNNKVGLTLVDQSEFTLRNVMVWTWYGAVSVGIRLQGREFINFDNVTVFADQPILIDDNPRSVGIDLDQSDWSNLFLVAADDTVPVIKCVAPFVTALTFSGAQSWINGNKGFEWIGGGAAGASYQMHFNNVRWEQSTAGGYFIDIEPSYLLFEVAITNCHWGTGTDNAGIKVRNTSGLKITNCFYGGTLEALNIDATVPVTVLDNYLCLQNSTQSIGTLEEVISLAPTDGANTPSPWRMFKAPGAITDLKINGKYFSQGSMVLDPLDTYVFNQFAGGYTVGMINIVATGATIKQGGIVMVDAAVATKIAGTANLSCTVPTSNLYLALLGTNDMEAVNNTAETLTVVYSVTRL